jgi:hypothetical protein
VPEREHLYLPEVHTSENNDAKTDIIEKYFKHPKLTALETRCVFEKDPKL